MSRDLRSEYLDEILEVLGCTPDQVVFVPREDRGPEPTGDAALLIRSASAWKATSPDGLHYVFIDDLAKQELERRAGRK